MMLKFLNKKVLFRIYLFSAFIFLAYSIFFNFFNNQDNYINNYLIFLKFLENNIFLTSIIFFIFCFVWIFFFGFGSPLSIIAGLLFELYLGFFIVLISTTLAATCIYYNLRNNIKQINTIKQKYSSNKFYRIINRNKYFSLILLRMLPGLPYQLVNVLPILFNLSIKGYFFSSLIGSIPSKFIIVFIAFQSKNQIIYQNEFFIEFLVTNYIYIISIILFIYIIFIIFKKYFTNHDQQKN